MVTNEITAIVEPGLVVAYERYMRERHVPDLMATGCFRAAGFSRAAPGRYRVRYDSPSDAELQRYLTAHAERLRGDFASHFPEGVSVSREVWVTLQGWDAGTGPVGRR